MSIRSAEAAGGVLAGGSRRSVGTPRVSGTRSSGVFSWLGVRCAQCASRVLGYNRAVAPIASIARGRSSLPESDDEAGARRRRARRSLLAVMSRGRLAGGRRCPTSRPGAAHGAARPPAAGTRRHRSPYKPPQPPQSQEQEEGEAAARALAAGAARAAAARAVPCPARGTRRWAPPTP